MHMSVLACVYVHGRVKVGLDALKLELLMVMKSHLSPLQEQLMPVTMEHQPLELGF